MPRILLLSNPRSGSCYLQDLLNCHPEIEIAGELLNDCQGPIENPLNTIEKALSELHTTYVGFKLFPEHLYQYDLSLGELVQTNGFTHVIVLWREELLDGLVSRCIALKNNEWYSTTKASGIRQLKIDPEECKNYIEQLTTEWERIGIEWPVDIRPVFVKFEELIKRPIEEVKRVLAEMSIMCDLDVFITPSERQNPAPVQQKVINYFELAPELRNYTLNVDKILLEKINVSLQIPKELLQFAPDREPCMPAGGWMYRVAEPYLPTKAKQNAFDAIQSGSISSAGYWPRELAKRLRAIFRCPVAQPCSNGFTALLLALQVADVGEGDEVLVPAMTMVAVPNAVYYLRARAIFADNAKNCYNPGWKEYERVCTPKTKAVVVTHTYGVPVPDIEIIARECHARGWILIEDISECVGISCTNANGTEQLLGTFGNFAIASLYANKIIHGGDGGFVIAKEAKAGKRLTSITNHGFTPSFHFVHFEQAPNAKIHGIGAAIAAGCLDEIEHVIAHRSQVAKWYRSGLRDLPIIPMPPCGPRDTPWVFGIQCKSKEERTALRAFLAMHGIETRDYFFCLHLQPAYLRSLKTLSPPSLPNAEVLGSIGFYLPTHTNLQQLDIDFICNLIRMYFSLGQESKISSIEAPERPMSKEIVQIKPDGFSVEVRKYRDTGELKGTSSRGHIYLEAVKLGLEAEESLFRERYDEIQLLMDSMKNVLERASQDPFGESMRKYFTTFIKYFESQQPLEQPINRPWLQVDLNDELFHACKTIPTTTDPETLQLLAWLIQQHRPQIIWEIGCWMGHATTLIAQVCNASGQNAKIFAMDAFRWQEWMVTFLKGTNLFRRGGKSFLEVFQENLTGFHDTVHPVEWPYDISKLPNSLENQKPQLVYLDITQEDEDLEEIWRLIKNSLIPNETIVLFNGMAHKSVPFFTRHSKELRAMAKPHTIAKAFIFVSPEFPKAEKTYDEIIDQAMKLERRVKFHTSPGWDHHHDNLFCKAVDVIRSELHSNKADILFVPAVEETLCDEPELLQNQPWIGIIHSVESHPEFFYTPDLERLCTKPRYLAAMQNCKGLFTLTSFQSQYLINHLPESLPKFPIQHVYYPIGLNGKSVNSSVVPKLMRGHHPIQLLHVGSFARDFDLLFNTSVPPQFRKVLVTGDTFSRDAALKASKDTVVSERLSDQEYEDKLRSSIVFLTLKYEGAANTLILECIARNVPILSPNMSSCVDYLGKDYPMLYDPKNITEQLEGLLSLENVENAIAYLEKMDKTKFTYDRFLNDVKMGAVMLSVPAGDSRTTQINIIASEQRKYDITLCICSYKRTHHLPKILESLWENQDYKGTYEIIVWNNNHCRSDLVHQYCRQYIEKSTARKSLEIISSTENHYCSIRFAMASLMKGENLLICDDDIIPGTNFISFFSSAHLKHPNDVLCVRGHEFLPHELAISEPRKVWMEYDSLRFRDDGQPEQLIHFVHADACLIPKSALHEVASVKMPDMSFALVDDYWMSYILSHKFNRKLRKLSTGGLATNPITRTDDSDTTGLALHTRPEVQDARLRLYVHHMLQGWPQWDRKALRLSDEEEKLMKIEKQKFWDSGPEIGFNISSTIDDKGIDDLLQLGTKCARIGAVGIGEKTFYEFSDLLTDPVRELKRLEGLIQKLDRVGIKVVLTFDRRLASPQTWSLIAEKFASFSNVVGYDIINEPFTEHERDLHWAHVESDVDDAGLENVIKTQKEIIGCIRAVDKTTPIILEPTFWGQAGALKKYPMENMMKYDDNLVMSFHFYEPMKLTSRIRNKGRFSFPCSVPWYDNVKFSEETFWNEEEILSKIKMAKAWADAKGVRIFLGEFGICRDIGGAPEYLEAVSRACKAVGLKGMMFSFRDPDWEAMDYEFGTEIGNCFRIYENENPFIKVIKQEMSK